jgi:hypothetical protein
MSVVRVVLQSPKLLAMKQNTTVPQERLLKEFGKPTSGLLP